jgi:hypothetical protein
VRSMEEHGSFFNHENVRQKSEAERSFGAHCAPKSSIHCAYAKHTK